MGIIIGRETGKFLYEGTCSTCAHAEKENKAPQKHHCYKNWDGSSASMETDIILLGFKEAESNLALGTQW